LALATLMVAACASGLSGVAVRGTSVDTPATTSTEPTTTTTGPSPTHTTVPTTTATAPTLAWASCGRDDSLQCAKLRVPLDGGDPSKGTIDLFLEKRPADQPGQRIGSLLVNPGGPGVPGTLLVDSAAGAYSPDLLNRFDIVGWDPRGTGKSRSVDCVDNLDPLLALDGSPDTPGEKQALIDAAKSFDRGCEQRSGAILPYISTQESARDMDRIRVALGEDKISYFGFSYGSVLGATYATLFPAHVRAMVIDGAPDPTANDEDSVKESAVGLERALRALLANCAKKASCAFHHDGQTDAAYDTLFASLDAHPLPVGGGRPPVGQGIATYAVLNGLYEQALWKGVTDALAAAEKGDGRPLLQLYDSYVERQDNGTFTNVWDSLIAINCLDDPGPTDITYPDRLAPVLEKISPHFGAWLAYGYTCMFWPVPSVKQLAITGKGAGPIVVVGTTGDPATPLEGTRHMAEALQGGVLVTVEGNRHTGYGLNLCVVRAVDSYLIDGVVPRPGLVCS
jgi:pimeloyl-ACP methyl ester carboxylesterase